MSAIPCQCRGISCNPIVYIFFGIIIRIRYRQTRGQTATTEVSASLLRQTTKILLWLTCKPDHLPCLKDGSLDLHVTF